MDRSRLRRLGALLVSAVLLAALTVVTAAPVAGAKASCQGRVATIVGTNGPDVLTGTNGPDVIAGLGGNELINGRGGNDLICGGAGRDRLVGVAGRDRLYGNGGPDRLIGGPAADLLFGGTGDDLLSGRTGNDRLNGGPGTDTCDQDTGTGPVVGCELPLPPPPPPPPPSLIPMTGILAVAFSDVDGLDGYSTGDVLIARLVDSDANNTPSVSDTIEMGRYPTDLAPSGFGDWSVKNHAVTSVLGTNPDWLRVTSAGGTHEWVDDGNVERYTETAHGKYVPGNDSVFVDGIMSPHQELLRAGSGSPSVPVTPIPATNPTRYGDDRFIDVIVLP